MNPQSLLEQSIERRITPSQVRRLTREHAIKVDLVIESIQRDGIPSYIKESTLRSIGKQQLGRDIELQLKKGFSGPSPRVAWRISKACMRHIKHERRLRGDHKNKQFDKNEYRPLVLEQPNEDPVPPQLPQGGLLRIARATADARKRLNDCVAAYNEDLKSDPGLKKGLPPATRIKQIFGAFAKGLAEPRAIEYQAVTGKEGAGRWRQMVCNEVFSILTETHLHLNTCIVPCDGRDDLLLIIDEAVDGVINDLTLPNGTLPAWRDDATREEKLEWFKVRNKIGSHHVTVYKAAEVDKKSFYEWRRGSLPDSSARSKRIEALLKKGKLRE